MNERFTDEQVAWALEGEYANWKAQEAISALAREVQERRRQEDRWHESHMALLRGMVRLEAANRLLSEHEHDLLDECWTRRRHETAIRALHHRIEPDPLCVECWLEWPCRTIRILDGGDS